MTAVPESVAEGFSFPTSLAFDDEGDLFVGESGLPFGGAPPGGRVWRLGAGGERTLVADGFAPPLNGLVWHHGSLYVSEATRITRLSGDGRREPVLDGLPGPGNYHTNMAVFGPDGKLYFSQGAMTNSGIVGLDAYELGWLRRLPHATDIPGHDITLTGVNVETDDPLTQAPAARTSTGAFVPFGTSTKPGQRIPAALPCTAAVMRCNPDGSELEVVAWGLRNAYGLGFLPDGRLLAIDQGADDRGTPAHRQRPGPALRDPPGRLVRLARLHRRRAGHRPPLPPDARTGTELPARQPPRAAATRAAAAAVRSPLSRRQVRGHQRRRGDRRRAVRRRGPDDGAAGPRVGRSLAIVRTASWELKKLTPTALVERPIDLRVGPDRYLYVLDFGHFEMAERGLTAHPGSGRLVRLQLPIASRAPSAEP